MWLIVAAALMGLGGLMALVGGIWMLVEQFRTGIVWGILCFFGGCLLGIPNLIWLIKYWKEGWRPLVVQLGGILPYVIGVLIYAAESSTAG